MQNVSAWSVQKDSHRRIGRCVSVLVAQRGGSAVQIRGAIHMCAVVQPISAPLSPSTSQGCIISSYPHHGASPLSSVSFCCFCRALCRTLCRVAVSLRVRVFPVVAVAQPQPNPRHRTLTDTATTMKVSSLVAAGVAFVGLASAQSSTSRAASASATTKAASATTSSKSMQTYNPLCLNSALQNIPSCGVRPICASGSVTFANMSSSSAS